MYQDRHFLFTHAFLKTRITWS